MHNLYVNIDSNSVTMAFLNYVVKKKQSHGPTDNITKEDLYPFVDCYRETQVTDLLINILGQMSNTDSRYWTTYADKYAQKEENGVQTDYTAYYHGIYTLNKIYGIDPLAVWIDRCREIGIRPWISFRMNDCHEPEAEASVLRSDFFYLARKNGWMLGEAYGYYRWCLNYQIEEVRNKFLYYIGEQLNRYDVHGIELDFMREIMCFPYLNANMQECTKIMNDFIRSIKHIVTAAEAKHGHKIRIAVRTMRSIEQNLFFGFDPQSWAAEGLVDLIIPTPRWGSSDSGIPVSEWKKALPNVEITAGIETLVNFENIAQTSAAIVRGLTAGYVSQGSDGIYLYNYFDQIFSENPNDNALSGHQILSPVAGAKARRDREVHTTCGSLDTIFNHPVRFAVIPQSSEGFIGGPAIWAPLPAALTQVGMLFKIPTGLLPAHKKQSLILGITSGTPEDTEVRFNDSVCTAYENVSMTDLPGIGAQPEGYVESGTLCVKYDIYSKAGKEIQEICLRSKSNKAVIISWIEIMVI